MTQGEIEALSREIERNARNLEIDIMLDIVRRIKSNLDIEQSMTRMEILNTRQVARIFWRCRQRIDFLRC